MSLNLVGGHVSFTDNPRERRIAMFPNCNEVRELAEVLSPCIIEITTCCEIEVFRNSNEKRLLIWDFKIIHHNVDYVPPYSLNEYENSTNQYASFPWLVIENCDCNCSTYTEGGLILKNFETLTLDENIPEDENVQLDDEDSLNDVGDLLGNIALDESDGFATRTSSSSLNQDDIESDGNSIDIDEEGTYSDADDIDSDADVDDDTNQDDLLITHTLPFKVIGVAHSLTTQDHLEQCMEKLLEQPHNVQVRIKPEPENEKDKNAISVQVNYSDEWHHVGYIASELTPYVHNALESNLLIECKIQHIKFRVHFFRPGFYMKLLLTKQGQWEPLVLCKSRSVR